MRAFHRLRSTVGGFHRLRSTVGMQGQPWRRRTGSFGARGPGSHGGEWGAWLRMMLASGNVATDDDNDDDYDDNDGYDDDHGM